MAEKIDFRVIRLKHNMGHGNARRLGLAQCRNRLIALMDADDISLPHRFETQLALFEHNPQLDIVGGQIAEFVDTPDNVIGIREVPTEDASIKQYLKKRCPMNQVSVMFKKDKAEDAGGYIDWYCEEDYYLWARMALRGCVFGNSPDVLVKVRVGTEMSARRGGLRYFRSEAGMQKFLLQKHLISLPRYLYNVAIRFIGEVLMPNRLRAKLFRIFRKQDRKKGVYGPEGSRPQPDIGNLPPFSVAMCVYGGDNPDWFHKALESIVNQTARPQEIVLVVDGPIPDSLETVIREYMYSSECGLS